MKDILIKLCREYVEAKKICDDEFYYFDPVRSITLQSSRNQRAMQIADLVVTYLDEIEVRTDSSNSSSSLKTGT